MKTRVIGLLVCAALMLFASMSRAEPATPEPGEPEPDQTSSPVESDPLRIEKQYAFEGMQSSYQDGYEPSVDDGRVQIILPLAPEKPIAGNKISARVGPGASGPSPFIFRGEAESVALTAQPVDGGAQTAEVFLFRADLELVEGCCAGNYPVEIRVSGSTQDGVPFEQTFVIHVVIREPQEEPTQEQPVPNGGYQEAQPDTGAVPAYEAGSPSGASAGETSAEKPVPVPRLMLSAHTVSPSPVVAGKSFSMNLTMKNMSRTQALTNVLINLTPEGGMAETDAPASFYFERIAPEKTVDFSVEMVAGPSAEGRTQRIAIECVYEGKNATQYTCDDSVSVLVTDPCRLEWDAVAVPEFINAGDTIAISVQAMNLGKGEVYNLRASIEAPGLVPESSLFLGNVPSGESRKGDLYAFVSSLDTNPNASPENRYGKTSGVILFSAEDADGQLLESQQVFETTIEPPVLILDNPEEEEAQEEDEAGEAQWVTALILICILIAILTGVLIHRKRLKDRT